MIENRNYKVLLEYVAHLTAATTASLRLGNSEDHAKYMAMAEARRRVALSSSVQGDGNPGRSEQLLFRVYAS